MEKPFNLGLDVDFVRVGSARGRVARVCVVAACGYTRDAGDPTITADCASPAELELEVERLRGELDEILAHARKALGAGLGGESAAEAAAPKQPGSSDKPRIASDLTAGDVMTRDVKTVDRNDRLSVADELMQVGRFRHTVVLDEDGGVAGVVSRRDVFHGALAWSLGQGRAAHAKALEAFPVKQVMHPNPVVVAPTTPLAEAAALLSEHKIGCLPVVEGGSLVGILTEGDFLALLSPI